MIGLKSSRSQFSIALLFALFIFIFGVVGCDEGENEDDSSSLSASADTDDDDSDDDDDSQSQDDDDSVNLSGLLEQFRPILVQRFAEDYDALPYPATSDQIGSVSLHTGDPDYDFAVAVDTEDPVFYEKAFSTMVYGRQHTQLVYAFFYPERPIPFEMSDNLFGYIEKFIWSGLIDGKVIRITLDANNEFPLFVEVSRNCGCDWKLWVNKIVETQAKAEIEGNGGVWNGIIKIGAPSDVDYVFVMPENIASGDDRVVFVADWGWTQYNHNPEGSFTSFAQWQASDVDAPQGRAYLPPGLDSFDAGHLETATYDVLDYDVLYNMVPVGGDTEVGIFDGFGYVWNSYSPLTKWMLDQCCFLEFPGTPRDLDHLEVVHEKMDFWMATELYDTFIHTPASLFDK